MIHDGLWDVYNDQHMGNCAEMLSKDRNFSREDQDNYAIESYNRSISASEKGIFKTEIVPVEVKQRRDNASILEYDEEPTRVRFEKIPNLRPAFESNGTITAANASKLNDGAAALLIMSDQKAKELGLDPLGSILGHASAAHEPEWFTTAPGKAMDKLLKKLSLAPSDIDLWEINEAFAVVAMAAIQDFNIDQQKVNIYGGAVALGHPIGASGARILTTLLNGMTRTGSKLGLATLCIGGGEASALIIQRDD
jgi:acetyl-CoA C-acetyltransferase